jgi:protease IV
MITDAELIVERRRLKRRLTFWRVAAALIFVGALAALAMGQGGFGDKAKWNDHIARLRIDGFISGDQATLDLIDEIAKSAKVKGLIVRIDSPGGSTAGSEALYERLRLVAKDKPVVAVMDTVAASGGYIAAIAADHIVARGNTITGSIGVIFSFPEISGLLGTLGVRMEEIKSGELKAEPSPYKPISEKARAVSNEMVQDSFAWFKGLVAERRKLPPTTVDILADGRVYTGRQAVKVSLVDELGGEEKAVDWLIKEKKLSDKLEIADWALAPAGERSLLGFASRALGFGDLRLQKLDGLVSVWHPDFK